MEPQQELNWNINIALQVGQEFSLQIWLTGPARQVPKTVKCPNRHDRCELKKIIFCQTQCLKKLVLFQWFWQSGPDVCELYVVWSNW